MSAPLDTPSDGRPESPARQRFLQRLAVLSIKPTTHEYYVRWAEAWNKARGHRSAGRGSVGVPPAVFGILPNTLLRMPGQRHIPARDILTIPWAVTCDWRGLADQAHSLV